MAPVLLEFLSQLLKTFMKELFQSCFRKQRDWWDGVFEAEPHFEGSNDNMSFTMMGFKFKPSLCILIPAAVWKTIIHLPVLIIPQFSPTWPGVFKQDLLSFAVFPAVF